MLAKTILGWPLPFFPFRLGNMGELIASGMVKGTGSGSTSPAAKVVWDAAGDGGASGGDTLPFFLGALDRRRLGGGGAVSTGSSSTTGLAREVGTENTSSGGDMERALESVDELDCESRRVRRFDGVSILDLPFALLGAVLEAESECLVLRFLLRDGVVISASSWWCFCWGGCWSEGGSPGSAAACCC